MPSESGLSVVPNGLLSPLLTETELPFDLEQQWQDLMSIMETQVRRAGWFASLCVADSGSPAYSSPLRGFHFFHVRNAVLGFTPAVFSIVETCHSNSLLIGDCD